MKRVALVIAVTMLVFAGCKPKKKGNEGDNDGMKPAALDAMVPVADMGGMAPGGDMGGMRPATLGDDTTAELRKIQTLTRQLAKIMEGIKTLDDLKMQKPKYLKLNVEILKLSIATLKKAVKLPPDQLKAYVAKSAAMNKANAEFGKKLAQTQKRIMELKGAKKFIAQTQKELGEKIMPLRKEMGALTNQYIKLTAPKVNRDGTVGTMAPTPKK